MTEPGWGLPVVYLLHMLATVVSVGGLTTIVFFLAPLAGKKKQDLEFISLQLKIMRRLEAVGWFCAALLVGTGLLQMSASPNYTGLLEIENRWSAAILIKHLFFFLMVLMSVYFSLVTLPGLRRSLLKASTHPSSPGREPALENLSAQIDRAGLLITIDLLFAIIILFFTAIARVS